MPIYDKLYDFQKHIVDKFKDEESLGLFLDMGLGKTPTALALAEANYCTKVIIVSINSKVLEDENVEGSWLWWAKQSSIKYDFYRKNQEIKATTDSNDILLINYESLFCRQESVRGLELKDNVKDFLFSCRGHNVAVIIDESHKMKTLQSKQTRAIFAIKKALRMLQCWTAVYLLTGTPFTQGYVDLYAQLKMLGCEMTKGDFMDYFCVRGNIPGLLGWQQPVVGYKNVDELYDLVHDYALTIKSEDVVKLPDKLFVYHPVECSHSFQMYVTEKISGKEIVKEAKSRHEKIDFDFYDVDKKVNNPYFRNIAYPDLKWIADTNGTFWLRARQLSIGFNGNAEDAAWYDRSRLEAIKQFLEEHEDNYLIFYNYTAELFELFDICESLGYKIDVYCGDIKSLDNYERYSKMTEAQKMTNKKNVIIANFASGSTGMNWQEYNKGIIASIPLFKDYEQGLKRLHRLGQKSTVVWHIFYQKNWLDYSMKKALDESTDYNLKMFEADLQRVNELTKE